MSFTPSSNVNETLGHGISSQQSRFVACEKSAFNSLTLQDPNMELIEDVATLHKYQIYVVEQWLTDRKRFSKTVTIYTGDAQHEIKVCVLDIHYDELTPFSKEVEAVFSRLQEDKCRAMETPLGRILVTELRRISSAYNLIHVPDGDYDAHVPDLVIAIDLRRLGCSGRSQLALTYPSAAKAKFLQTYKVNASIPFEPAVMEFVSIIQSILILFGLLPRVFNDGLLCDTTLSSMKKFRAIYVNFEQSFEDTFVSPKVLSFMLLKVVNLRNKLHFLGYHDVPKDPFTNIEDMMIAVRKFQEENRLPATGFLDITTISPIDQKSRLKMSLSKTGQAHHLPKHFRSKLDELNQLDQIVIPALDYVGQNIGIERVRYLWTARAHNKSTEIDPFVEAPTAFRIFRGMTRLVSRPMEHSKAEDTPGFIKGIKEGMFSWVFHTNPRAPKDPDQKTGTTSRKIFQFSEFPKDNRSIISKGSTQRASFSKAPNLASVSSPIAIEKGRKDSNQKHELTSPGESSVGKLLFENFVVDRRPSQGTSLMGSWQMGSANSPNDTNSPQNSTKEEPIDSIEPKDDTKEKSTTEPTSSTMTEPLVSQKINEELMMQLQKRQQDLLSLAEMLEEQLKKHTWTAEILEVTYDRFLNSYRDLEILAQTVIEEHRDMDENFKNAEVQSSRLQYRIATCEERYKEAQEMLETLDEHIDGLGKDLNECLSKTRYSNLRQLRMVKLVLEGSHSMYRLISSYYMSTLDFFRLLLYKSDLNS